MRFGILSTMVAKMSLLASSSRLWVARITTALRLRIVRSQSSMRAAKLSSASMNQASST
jgi:hypothetical protein